MNIKRVKYKMCENDNWKVGYMVARYEGENTTLLDYNFKYVPKITSDGEEYIAYDFEDDLDKFFNITIPL